MPFKEPNEVLQADGNKLLVKERPILSIIIPVFNKWNFTKSCLEDLFQLKEEGHEIIIIDNASSDETQKECLKYTKSNFKYVRNEENVFHSKACNQGFKLSAAENVLFLNNDIRIQEDKTNWTKDLIMSCSDGSIVGPTMGTLDNNLNFVKESNEQLEGNSYISGWCIAAKRETWNKLNGPWNEEFPFYFNDTDLSFRARLKQIELKVIKVPIIHFGKISASQINVQNLYKSGREIFITKWKK